MQRCRFDQSAYPYLVEEAVKGVDNSVQPIPLSQAPSLDIPQAYPLNQNFKRSTGVRPGRPCCPEQLINSDEHRYIPQLSVPSECALSSLDVTSHNKPRNPSQLFTNQQRQQASSFSINQHIGLNEPPVVNASQLNNSIKIQYQFDNDDRFAVQSTSTRESVDPAIVNLSNTYQGENSTECSRILPDLTDQSEIGQYSVFNISRKDCANVDNSSKINNSLSITLEEARDSFTKILENEKKKTTIIHKKGIEKLGQNKINSVKSLNAKQSKISSEQESNEGLTVGKDLCNRKDIKTTKKQKAEIVKTSLDKGKALTSAIKTKSKKSEASVKPKAKTKTAYVKKNKTVSSTKKSIPKGKRQCDEITLLKLTYQCGECTNVYHDIEDLVKHISENHTETPALDKGNSVSHNIETAKEFNESLKSDGKINSENLNDSDKTVESEMSADLRKGKKHDKEINEGLTLKEGAEQETMTSETVELMEIDSENKVSEPESFLCPLCGYPSKSLDEEENHTRMHDSDSVLEKKGQRVSEGDGYLKQYIEMIEHQQKKNEESNSLDEIEQEDIQTSVNNKIQKVAENNEVQNKRKASGTRSKKVSDQIEPSTDNIENPLEKAKTGLRKRQTSQAKNSLMNPSKGKQKRVRDTQNFGKEDRMLMEMFCIIPSKVCLSRVENSDNSESKNIKDTDKGPNMAIEDTNNIKKECECIKDGSVTRNKKVERNHWSKVLSMSNCEEEVDNVNDINFDNDDSDVEIVEPPMTLIVLDEEVNIEPENKDVFSNLSHKDLQNDADDSSKKPDKDSPRKSENESPKMSERESPKKSEKGSPKKSEKSSLKKSEKGSPKKFEKESPRRSEKDSPKKTEKVTPMKSVKDSTGKIEKVSPRKLQGESPNKSNKDSPAVSGKKGKGRISARNVSQDTRKDEESQEISRQSKSDAELLEKYGIKNLSVNLTNSTPKKKLSKPSPRSKSETSKRQLRESKSTSHAMVKDIEEMSPSEIEKLLYECGMGITVPVQSKISINDEDSPCRDNQTPSPVPSTSKGHGHLKRKRTARKSTKDSALFKKYKLKDSKVIVENLSRIDVSLIRNPNSPFGKSDWLKHKFDSDTESDFEFDIPTPPLVEEFVDSELPLRSDKQKASDLNTKTVESKGTPGRKSPLKQKELQELEKFGISESVVVIDSPRKSQNASSPIKRKSISDDELRKRFGIPNTMVIINTSEKTQENHSNSTFVKLASENKQSKISFADFKSALDTARKNILSNMKADSVSDSQRGRRNVSKQNKTELIRKPITKVKQNKNKTASKFKESIDEPSYAKRKLRFHSSANDNKYVLPMKLKTLTVDANKSKLNETCKTLKAKAVSRAIETKRKKDKIARELDNNVNKDGNKATEETLSSSRKRLRENVSDNVLVKVSKRKCFDVKAKQVGSKEIKHTREIQVVKTARYRRSIKGDKNLDKKCPELDLKELTKGLPIVKVAVPCLTNEQIVRLSQNIEDSTVSIQKNIKLSSDVVANEIINEIIDKVCLSQDLANENSELSDYIEETFEGNSSLTTSGSGNLNATDTNVESDFLSGEEKAYSLIETLDVSDSSDLSLISVTLENKENETDSFTHCTQKGSNDDNIKEDTVKKPSQIDVIPLGKILFYDEGKLDDNVSEDLTDEVDGDYLESTRISQTNQGQDENRTFEGDTEENPNESGRNPIDTDITNELMNSAKELLNSKTDDGNEEKENRNDDVICESEICAVESSKTFRNAVKENENMSKDNTVMKVQILSAIIDSESGSLIGDVYSVNETAGNSSDSAGQEKGDRKEIDFSRNVLENVARMSRSTSPEDIIETLTES